MTFELYVEGQQPLILRSRKCQKQMVQKYINCPNKLSHNSQRISLNGPREVT